MIGRDTPSRQPDPEVPHEAPEAPSPPVAPEAPARDPIAAPAARWPGRRLVLAVAPLLALALGGGYLLVMVLRLPAPVQGEMEAAPQPAETEALADAARGFLRRNEAGKARVVLEEAIDRYPVDQQLRLLLGETLLTLGELEGAYQQYSTAINLGPDHAAYRDNAAIVAKQVGLDEDAIAHWRVAQQLDPSNPKYPLFLGNHLRNLHRPDEARKHLMIAANLDPQLALAWASLAALALDENRPSVAQGYIAHARRIEPASTTYRILEARILRRRGSLEDAEDAANLLYALPDDVRLHDHTVLAELSKCLGLLGKPERAAELYAEAVGLNPADPELSFQAALWHERAGDADKAATYAARAATRGHEQARAMAKRLAADPTGE